MDFSITPVSASYLEPTQSGFVSKADVGAASTSGASSPPPSLAPAYKPIQDTVKLSTTAQAHSMEQSGASVSQIAANLGLTSAEVDQDLGIATSSSSSQASVLAALSAKT